jgi:hypothetical protein
MNFKNQVLQINEVHLQICFCSTGGVVGLEEEYHRALAENIVKELNQPKYRKESSIRGRAPSRDSSKSAKRVPVKGIIHQLNDIDFILCCPMVFNIDADES